MFNYRLIIELTPIILLEMHYLCCLCCYALLEPLICWLWLIFFFCS